jgi:CPA2 family monovalent cation:H+ antiporter-2
VDELQHERLTTVTLPLGAKASGKTLGFFTLHAMGVRVVNLRRISGKAIDIQDNLVLQDGDALVLSGTSESLSLAESKLLKG